MNFKIAFSLLFFLTTINGFAQKITIDGNVDELEWKNAFEFNEFKTFKPNIGNNPSESTSV